MTQTRIKRELDEMRTGPPDNCSAGLADSDDLHKWQATIVGPEKTPFEGGVFKLSIVLPLDYPFKPPQVTLLEVLSLPLCGRTCGFTCMCTRSLIVRVNGVF
ncbi:hypothetical protein HPB50_029420 [Hyalomma asiaticum]|nr:hypothetical protein HPB50_029420 [Hyalomma asiaticum]